MDAYKELLDFKGYEKRIPCPLCGKESVPTVLGDHFKCSNDDHLFNENGSPLPDKVECYCEACIPKQPEMEELNPKLLSKIKKKIASVKKKLKRKKK
jgi:hypothetical protein